MLHEDRHEGISAYVAAFVIWTVQEIISEAYDLISFLLTRLCVQLWNQLGLENLVRSLGNILWSRLSFLFLWSWYLIKDACRSGFF